MSLPRTIAVPAEAHGQRLDAFLAAQLDGVSRSRVQLLLDQGDVLVDGDREKPSLKLRGGEQITITGDPHPAPLKAVPEAIPLDVVYEDTDLAVVNKPAGMMVHAGAGQSGPAAGQEGAAAGQEYDARSRGTLVNALLHRFNALSSTGGELRPGIVHRLDKSTSGLIIVAKNDRAHAALGAMFAGRRVQKTYIALVHGAVAREKGTITAAVSRDPVRRTRMTTRPSENARSAVSHYEVAQAPEHPLRQIHPAARAHRNRPHAPDPRAHGLHRPSCGGRYALWRRGAVDCATGSREHSLRHQENGPRAAEARAQLSPRGKARIHASPHRQAAPA